MRLHPFDALTRDHLRLTTPSRTIVDLAATLEGRALRETVERAQDLRRFDPKDINATLGRAPRRPGTQRLNDLITLMAPDSDNARSHLERLFLKLTRKAKLPKPTANHEIAGRRDRELTALGWRPVRFTYEEVAFEPSMVGEELVQLLRNARTAAT